MRRFGKAGSFGAALLLACSLGASAQDATNWTATWGASPVFPVGREIGGSTVRQYVRLSVGGARVRVRFSNETGTSPLRIGAARIAKPGNAAGSVDAASSRPLLFGGETAVTVPAGAPMLSDPVDLPVEPLSTLAISLFVPRATGPSVTHPLGVQTAFVVSGDKVAETSLEGAETSLERFYVSGVEVANDVASPPPPAVVAFGDSITDGYGSTPNANRRWPDRLAERLAQRGTGRAVGVVNAGISGNRVLHDRPQDVFGPAALARLDRDALSRPGIRWLVVMEGINDIGHATQAGLSEQAVTAAEIIAGHKQIVARAKAKGVKVYGATLTPFEGTVFPGYFTPEGEEKRQAVNQWIRTGGAYDAVIDFDAALRDPANPTRVRPEFDEGDHLHPNDAGYKAMADAVDLALFD